MSLLNKYVEDNLSHELRIVRGLSVPVLTGLTEHERALVYKYTDLGYLVNRQLLATMGVDYGDFGLFLSHALAKIPDYRGIVYRKVYLTAIEISRYFAAKLTATSITEHFFISTSKFISIAYRWRGLTGIKPNCMFVIMSKTGKEIEYVSKYPDEMEVLFLPNISYNVLNVIQEPDFIQITMEEL